MPELGFSIDRDFAAARRNARERRNVDSLIKTRGRAPVEMYVVLTLFSVLALVIAGPDRVAQLLRAVSLH